MILAEEHSLRRFQEPLDLKDLKKKSYLLNEEPAARWSSLAASRPRLCSPFLVQE